MSLSSLRLALLGVGSALLSLLAIPQAFAQSSAGFVQGFGSRVDLGERYSGSEASLALFPGAALSPDNFGAALVGNSNLGRAGLIYVEAGICRSCDSSGLCVSQPYYSAMNTLTNVRFIRVLSDAQDCGGLPRCDVGTNRYVFGTRYVGNGAWEAYWYPNGINQPRQILNEQPITIGANAGLLDVGSGGESSDLVNGWGRASTSNNQYRLSGGSKFQFFCYRKTIENPTRLQSQINVTACNPTDSSWDSSYP